MFIPCGDCGGGGGGYVVTGDSAAQGDTAFFAPKAVPSLSGQQIQKIFGGCTCAHICFCTHNCLF